ncbi:hypothetical protein GMLC_32010 [Geomonas limicola]|uniref:Uncharacterized protein n=1 Tax=Geomonas limicola TaxID=2740186 RepID=A0A6V8NAI6_9BACT|nr:hypothetical protein [Geomonas limicola]GFO69622.1 hypothetical protein GMLC_32010 [Geomonas limicola]
MPEHTEKTICTCVTNHEHHICALHSKGLVEEAERLTDNPTVTCSICLVNANSPENVCSPTTLGGGFKYSDMKDSKKILCESVDAELEKEP